MMLVCRLSSRVSALLLSLLTLCLTCLPAYAGALTAPKAMNLHLQPLDGQAAIDIQHSRGVVVVQLWASWCPYCRVVLHYWQSLPKLSGVQYYIVSFRESTDKAKRYLDEHGHPFDRHLLLSPVAAKRIQAHMVPDTMIFVHGRLVYRHQGGFSKQAFQDVMLMQLSKIVESVQAVQA